ncbi:hypothetical protein KI387_017900, partial [Taxus chinensis]
LDFSVGTRTFATKMREHNVTIDFAAINLRAPFNEMMAFFDNTLDLIHIGGIPYAWINFQLLDLFVFDWDR